MHIHHSEVADHGALPLVWTPTSGNIIPPHAVPLCEGPSGQLYIARGSVSGEIYIGTTSHTSSEGARLHDSYGRNHTVFEYEVLTCASHIRFLLETSQPFTPVAEPARPTPRPIRTDVPTGVLSPMPKKPGRLAPVSWLGATRGQLSATPNEKGKKHPNDPPPYTGPPGGWVEVPKQSGPVALSARENVQFDYLARSKCFALIDDTTSMQYSWSQTRAALAGFIDKLSSNSKWDGLDVRFLHHAQGRPCVKTREEFESVFNSVTMWRGEKEMTTKVSQVFEEGLPLVCETSSPRPVNLLIITDGIASDTHELFDAMVYFRQKLNAKCVLPHLFRIHLLQMGDDRKAVQPLHDFRDGITQRDRDRRILNVVSYHRGRGLLSAESIFKLLLASTYIPAKEDPSIGERLPPEVVEAQYNEIEKIRTLGKR